MLYSNQHQANKMKTKTILKTIGFLIGWIASIQLISVGFHIMNQPSNVAFPLGLLFTLLLFTSAITCAGKFGSTLVDLYFEYRDSKEVKQDKKE